MADELQKTISNNQTTIITQKRALPPLTAIKMFFPTGSCNDPAGKEGLAVLTGELLTTSSEKYDIYEFGRHVEKHGLKVSSSVSRDYTVLSFSATNDNIEALFEVANQVLSSAVFDGEAFERTRARQIASIRSRREQAFSAAADNGVEFFYGEHPYATPLRGYEKSVNSLTPEDCRYFFETYFSKKGLVVSGIGNCTTEQLAAIANNLKNKKSLPTKSQIDFATQNGRKIIEMDIDQPTHLLFYPAPPARDPDYIPLQIFESLLGKGMGSILFQEIREKLSLGYQVGVKYPSLSGPSYFMFYLGGGDNEGKKFEAGLQNIINRLTTDINDQEFERALNYSLGSFLMNHETGADIAWYRGFFQLLGRGVEFDSEFPEKLKQVNKKQLCELNKNLFEKVKPAFVSVIPR